MRRMESNPRKKLLNDNGFTLVELIIVIAIIAILTGISFLTITMINSGRAKDAAISFETEISDIITKSKNQVCYDNDGNEQPTFERYIEIYQDSSGRYHVQKGYYDPKNDNYTAYADTSGTLTEDYKISSRVVISYTDPSGVTKLITSDSSLDSSDASDYSVTDVTNNVYIVFDNNGYCVEGAGTFNFHKKNGMAVASVSVRKNGSHQSN